jgi:hypothetical protein
MRCSGPNRRHSLSFALFSLLLLAPDRPCAGIDSFLSNNPQAPDAVPYGRSVDERRRKQRAKPTPPPQPATPPAGTASTPSTRDGGDK